ncbi:DNA starvation/stationary phase protection protein [Puteibacter caeruleilacunae]|nr:DNA starvation/stationary phase protection protein [Puteibacter caeruleilacunae]
MKTENQNTVEQLNQLLADYQIYYQNLRGLHWNVKGRLFFSLHAKFESYYDEASEAIDEIAERILMLGGKPLHTFGDYINKARLPEVANVSDGIESVQAVLDNNKYLLSSFNEILSIAGEAGDEGTVGMISGWIGETEKRIWMLEAFLA